MPAPKVLIAVANFEHHGSARLPEAFKQAGFEVGVICHVGSTLSHSSFVDRFLAHRERSGPAYRALMTEAMQSWRPDLIVPVDEMTLWMLTLLRAQLREISSKAPVNRVLDRSLGAFEQQEVIVLKSRLAGIAGPLGVRMPAQLVDPAPEAALAFAAQHGYPVLVKHDRSFGGNGVVLCRDAAALRTALARDAEGLGGYNGPRSRAVQQFIPGETAAVGFAASGGKLLAGYAVRIVETFPGPFGPSSVVRHLDDPRLLDVAARLVAHFGYNGLGGADFRLAAGSGEPFLLEFNARAFANPHLGRYFGVDLCAALRAGLEGSEYRPGPVREPGPIALFPMEWARDPESPYLSGCHDVPWHDRMLLQHLVGNIGSRLRSLDVLPTLPDIPPRPPRRRGG